MGDRELLGLAAKAIGCPIDMVSRDGPNIITQGECLLYSSDGIHWTRWNPLDDDGDALRLAVVLRLEIQYHLGDDGPVDCRYWLPMRGQFQVTEEINGDACAATRRAIVRAAAEIGCQMA